jgi:hypothetical protein
MGVPDMAVGPLYYSLYDSVCVRLTAEFADAGKSLPMANRTPLAAVEVDALVEQLMVAGWPAIADLLVAHLKAGRSIRSLGDAIQIGAAELILRTTVPRQFTNGQHPFDYCNVANNWLRRTASPYQARILFLMACFVNDSAHENKLYEPIIDKEIAGYAADGHGAEMLLRELDETLMRLDIPGTSALADAYLKSGADRHAYEATVALCASRFQDDPHNQKIAVSAFEEYAHNATHLKDRLLLAAARQLAGWTKMPGERECYARFEKEWIDN